MSPFVPGLILLLAPAATAAEPDTPDEHDDGQELEEADGAVVTERDAPRPREPLGPEADFLRNDVEFALRVGFNGTNLGPFSLLTALSGWNEVSLRIDIGVATWRSFTVGVGVVGHAAYGLTLGALLARIANYDDRSFSWQMWEAGAVGRVTLHYTRLQSVDPYLFAGLGAGLFHLDASVDGWGDVPRQGLDVPYLRAEAGGGLDIPLGKGLYVNVELRYLLAVPVGARDRLVFERGEDLAVFTLAAEQGPPRGFSWVLGAGYRF